MAPLPAEVAKSLNTHNLFDLWGSLPPPHTHTGTARKSAPPGGTIACPLGQALSALLITICCYHSTQQGTPELPSHHPHHQKSDLALKCRPFLYCTLPHYHHQTRYGTRALCPFPKKVLPPSQSAEGGSDFWLEQP